MVCWDDKRGMRISETVELGTSSGGTTAGAVRAAELLAKDGLSARVINIHTIKPLDVELLARAARETGRILTVEDHQITGGLGGAVCEALADLVPAQEGRAVLGHLHRIAAEIGAAEAALSLKAGVG